MLVLVGDTPMSPEFHNIHQNIRNKTATTTKVMKVKLTTIIIETVVKVRGARGLSPLLPFEPPLQ